MARLGRYVRATGAAITVEGPNMGVWQLDPYHTQIDFSAKHLGMMTVRGTFTDVTSTGSVDPDHPETCAITVTIQMNSIKTHHGQRDDHLRSADFLEVEKYPTATFTTTGVTQTGADTFELAGDLTIKATTKPVTVELTRLGEFNDPSMGHRIAYTGGTKISRKEFGVNFNAVLDGKFVVSDEVTISLDGELIEQPQTEPAAAG